MIRINVDVILCLLTDGIDLSRSSFYSEQPPHLQKEKKSNYYEYWPAYSLNRGLNIIYEADTKLQCAIGESH